MFLPREEGCVNTNANDELSDYTPEEYRTLKRKIDRFLLPLMYKTYSSPIS